MTFDSIYNDESAATVTVIRDGVEMQITLAEYFAEQQAKE